MSGVSRNVRGIRTPIPAGYVVGRLNGSGAAQLIRIADLAQQVAVSGVPSPASAGSAIHYDLGCYVPGTLSANQTLLFHRFTEAVTIPANFGNSNGRTSQAGGSVNATGSTTITVAKAVAAIPLVFSTVGSIVFGAGTVAPTFASSGGTAISFAVGDILRLQAPVTPDATLADFFATICGTGSV